MVLVGRPERHHEARRAEAALRAVAVDHRLLHRVQRAGRMRVFRRCGVPAGALRLQILDREQRLAVQCRQELDAGVDGAQLQPADGARLAIGRQLTDHHGAGTAIAFVAAFLGAGAARVLAQPVEHRARGVNAGHLHDTTAMEESNGLCVGAHVSWVCSKKDAAVVCTIAAARSPCRSALVPSRWRRRAQPPSGFQYVTLAGAGQSGERLARAFRHSGRNRLQRTSIVRKQLSIA